MPDDRRRYDINLFYTDKFSMTTFSRRMSKSLLGHRQVFLGQRGCVHLMNNTRSSKMNLKFDLFSKRPDDAHASKKWQLFSSAFYTFPRSFVVETRWKTGTTIFNAFFQRVWLDEEKLAHFLFYTKVGTFSLFLVTETSSMKTCQGRRVHSPWWSMERTEMTSDCKRPGWKTTVHDMSELDDKYHWLQRLLLRLCCCNGYKDTIAAIIDVFGWLRDNITQKFPELPLPIFYLKFYFSWKNRKKLRLVLLLKFLFTVRKSTEILKPSEMSFLNDFRYHFSTESERLS